MANQAPDNIKNLSTPKLLSLLLQKDTFRNDEHGRSIIMEQVERHKDEADLHYWQCVLHNAALDYFSDEVTIRSAVDTNDNRRWIIIRVIYKDVYDWCEFELDELAANGKPHTDKKFHAVAVNLSSVFVR